TVRRRARIALAVARELHHRRRVLVRRVLERLDDVVGLRVKGDGVGEAVGDDGPGRLLRAEVLRKLDREDAPLPAGEKMRRLPLIGPALEPLDAVAGADRDIELLLRVPVEVADERALAAVLLVVPALEGGRDARAALADRRGQRQRAWQLADALRRRLGRRLSRAHERAARRRRNQQPDTGDLSSPHS